MKITAVNSVITITAQNYKAVVHVDDGICSLSLAGGEPDCFTFPVATLADSLGRKESLSGLSLKEPDLKKFSGGGDLSLLSLVFTSSSDIWKSKEYVLAFSETNLEYFCRIEGEKLTVDTLNFFTDRRRGIAGSFVRGYAPRFDWSRGKVFFGKEADESLGCNQWLSPPPFCYSFETAGKWLGCGIAARPGEWNFYSFQYRGSSGVPSLTLTYENHTVINGLWESPHALFFFGKQEENEILADYADFLRKEKYILVEPKEIPAWWREPIFCGWGQQRLEYRADHDDGENGWWANCGDYSCQPFYEKFLGIMESKGVSPGTVIIDCFWTKRSSYAEPHPFRWPDMRGFIDKQHKAGRKVLLWYTPVVAEGMQKEACMTLGDTIIAPDPTSPEFKRIQDEEIYKMLSSDEGCLNADGFKIDFTQSLPSEREQFRSILNNRWALVSEKPEKVYPSLDDRTELIKTHEPKWGAELIRAYIESIYHRMKEVKKDSVLITHTANPYFADVVDILRLNDLDGTSPDVLGIMGNRAVIASICNPYWLLDTDNDLMVNKDMWRKYIELQPRLGIPDTYYATGIAQSGEMFDDEDYALLRRVWDAYRASLRKK